MIRLIAIAAALALAAPAFAQQLAPTDQEIAEAHKLCNRPENFEPKTAPPAGAGRGPYKPEYKDRCEAIDAEHAKRDIAGKAKKTQDLNRLDSIIGRISK